MHCPICGTVREAEFDAAEHPRWPAGTPEGGQFMPVNPADAPSVKVGGGGRAPAGGLWVSEVYYGGGQFLPEELPRKRQGRARREGKRAALQFDKHDNIAEITITASSFARGNAMVQARLAGQRSEKWLGKFETSEEAVEFAKALIAEQNARKQAEGWAPHPTQIRVGKAGEFDTPERVKERSWEEIGR